MKPNEISEVVKFLNILLADYHIYYQKLRNFHWNVQGEHFFDLHTVFEDLYNDASEKIDDLAERILSLQGKPLSNYSQYLKTSTIDESSSEKLSSVNMVKELVNDHRIILVIMRRTIEKANIAKDEGTIDLIGAYIRELEKSSWMLDVWLKKPVHEQQIIPLNGVV